ncbi:ABC transporter substrate-binding protein [Ferrovibrio xuzhouensis]|uniref:ABC transporter substrate-binding protein n=1 Tax=Ferrovibrio xuzhouensis TaxID=1576914 RepID=A0ABV7VLN7_9PROT
MKLDRRQFLGTTAVGIFLPSLALAQGKASGVLYEAAKKEGELTWYIVHITSETAEKIGRAFTEKYPGVKVNVVRTTAQVAFQRLNQDLQSKVANCDVFASTDLGHYVDLKKRKLLMSYEPSNASEIDPRFRNVDPDNQFIITSATFIAILYNTDKVKAADAPKSWKELIDPKWTNQVSVGHPGFSGFVGTWVVQMKKLYGWDYFKKLAAIKPQVGRSIIDTVTATASGERSVAAGPGALAQYQASRGNPIGVSYPSEGSVLMASPSSIMANAPHPNASKLFLEFLWGSEVADITAAEFGTPLRPDTKVRPGVLPLDQMKTIRPSVEEVVTGIPEVTEDWRDLFGI